MLLGHNWEYLPQFELLDITIKENDTMNTIKSEQFNKLIWKMFTRIKKYVDILYCLIVLYSIAAKNGIQIILNFWNRKLTLGNFIVFYAVKLFNNDITNRSDSVNINRSLNGLYLKNSKTVCLHIRRTEEESVGGLLLYKFIQLSSLKISDHG